MSLKAEIETWVKALGFYDSNDFEMALKQFDNIADTSKILFNCGVIYATLGEHEKAVESYQQAIQLDQYLAVAYFQQGVSNFLVGDFEEGLANFNDTLLYLRGNNMIDYNQLGLQFKLYSCEVLFNRGLCYIYLEQRDAGMQDFQFAVKEKVVEDHNVIDEAIAEEAEGYTVFSIPVGVVYRPNAAKVKNLKTKDYLGKARLVAVESRAQAFTGFQGSTYKDASKNISEDDREKEQISYAATNLVKPKTELPTTRSDFPPTPPPENDRRSISSRAASVKGGAKPMLKPLDTQRARPRDHYEVVEAKEERRGQMKSRMSQDSTYPPGVIDMYNTPSRMSKATVSATSSVSRGRPFDPEESASVYDDENFNEDDFEMQRPPGARSRSVANASGRSGSRRFEISKIRVKVHSEDIRYIMVPTSVEWPDLYDRIRDKFALKKRFKLKIKDEDEGNGDLITLSDQDDLEMAIEAVKAAAKREGTDQGKMEVWIYE